jgi:hypothetical protein
MSLRQKAGRVGGRLWRCRPARLAEYKLVEQVSVMTELCRFEHHSRLHVFLSCTARNSQRLQQLNVLLNINSCHVLAEVTRSNEVDSPVGQDGLQNHSTRLEIL